MSIKFGVKSFRYDFESFTSFEVSNVAVCLGICSLSNSRARKQYKLIINNHRYSSHLVDSFNAMCKKHIFLFYDIIDT